MMNGQAQLAAILFAGMVSQGDGTSTEPGVSAGKLEASRTRPEIVEISDPACALVTEHVPAANVAYQPGVSTTGKQVASADLNPSSYSLRPIYQFDVEITPESLSDKYKGQTGLPVATITYEPETGKVLLDGEEMVWLHEKALYAACAARNAKK